MGDSVMFAQRLSVSNGSHWASDSKVYGFNKSSIKLSFKCGVVNGSWRMQGLCNDSSKRLLNLTWRRELQKKHIENTNHFPFQTRKTAMQNWEATPRDNPTTHAEIRNWIALYKQMPQAIVKVLFNLGNKCTLLSWHIFYFLSSMCNGQISSVTLPIILNTSSYDLINRIPWLSNLKIKNLRDSISKFQIIPDSFLLRNEYKHLQPTVCVFIVQAECGTCPNSTGHEPPSRVAVILSGRSSTFSCSYHTKQ